MKNAIPEQTLTNSHAISQFGISEENFRFLEYLRSYNQPPTNSDNTVQPAQHDIPVHLQEFIITTVKGIVDMQNQRSPWYEVQCLDCEKAADALGVETDTVRIWIKSGKLVASKVGREWLIRLADVDKMLKQNATVVSMPDMRFSKKFKSKVS